MKKAIFYVLSQEQTNSKGQLPYLNGRFETDGDVSRETIEDIQKFFARVRKYKMKTTFKFGKKFTLAITEFDIDADGNRINKREYRSIELFGEKTDSGATFTGGITYSDKRPAQFEAIVEDTFAYGRI